MCENATNDYGWSGSSDPHRAASRVPALVGTGDVDETEPAETVDVRDRQQRPDYTGGE